MYRDDEVAAGVRSRWLRAEITRLRVAGLPRAWRRLLAQHRRIARARRATGRLRDPTLRLLPRSLGELAIAVAVAYTLAFALLLMGVATAGMVRLALG